MIFTKSVFRISSLFILLTLSLSSNAQFIIEQVDFQSPVPYQLLPENTEIENLMQEAQFFFNVPIEKLKQSAEEEGSQVDYEKQTIYIKGDNIAVDIQDKEMGNITSIFDVEKRMFYLVLWSQKTVMTLSEKELKEFKQQAEEATQKMLANLSPEMQKQIKESMDNSSNQKKPDLYKTGKKKEISGFLCEQYTLIEDEKHMDVWVTKDNMDLSQKISDYSMNISKIFGSEEEDEIDVWNLVAGAIPIQVKTYSIGMMEGPTIEISSITKIEKSDPPDKKFIPPGPNEGFIVKSFKESMNQFLPEN